MISTSLLSLIFISCATKSVGKNPASAPEESAVENQTNPVENEVATESTAAEPIAASDANDIPTYVTGENGKQYLELEMKQIKILKKPRQNTLTKTEKKGLRNLLAQSSLL